MGYACLFFPICAICLAPLFACEIYEGQEGHDGTAKPQPADQGFYGDLHDHASPVVEARDGGVDFLAEAAGNIYLGEEHALELVVGPLFRSQDILDLTLVVDDLKGGPKVLVVGSPACGSAFETDLVGVNPLRGPFLKDHILGNLVGTGKGNAKGAQGNEAETVLVLGDDVVNKTLPTILCDEDDVAGNHGATIGSVSPEQLAFLASRGLSRTDAEQLFVRALYEDALMHAPCPEARAVVENDTKGQSLCIIEEA